MGATVSKPAIFGGEKAITLEQSEANRWPLIGEEEVMAVTDLLRRGELSISSVTRRLEEEFARYVGRRFGLAHNNGTAAIHAAMFALGVGDGDEVICPTYTFWASCMQALALGAEPVLCDSDPGTLCLDPADVERKITSRTKAIIAVHLWGMPAEMDRLRKVALEKGVPIVEDASHAHGAEYGGRKIGALTEIAAFSFQTSKLMVAGEGGILVTDDPSHVERATLLGHYERIKNLDSDLKSYHPTPFGFKYRISPLCAAVALEQLKKLDSMNARRNGNVEYLYEKLRGLPGLRPVRAPEGVRRVYYENVVLYCPEELHGLPADRFVEALRAEGAEVSRQRYPLLHQQRLFQERPPVFGRRLITREYSTDDFPRSRAIVERTVRLPSLTQAPRELMDQYAVAFEKVALSAKELLEGAARSV